MLTAVRQKRFQLKANISGVHLLHRDIGNLHLKCNYKSLPIQRLKLQCDHEQSKSGLPLKGSLIV